MVLLRLSLSIDVVLPHTTSRMLIGVPVPVSFGLVGFGGIIS
jgi:hypothetical protein